MSGKTKRWVRLSTDKRGETTVSVSLVEGNDSAKWVGRAFSASLKDDIKRALEGARRNLTATQQALAELDEEEQ